MGEVLSIHIAPDKQAPLQSVSSVRAEPDRGLEGDRYFNHIGTFSKDEGPKRNVTLIESEAIEALGRDYDIKIEPSQPRRNIVTRGIALNHLVGREFTVGGVRMRGIKLCEPCMTMEKFVGIDGVRDALIHRGGLRAQVLTEGVIKVGDPIQ